MLCGRAGGTGPPHLCISRVLMIDVDRQNRAVAGAQLQHPVPPLLHGDAHAPAALHADGAQRAVLRQLNHQLDEDLIHRVGGDDLAGRRAGLHLRHIRETCIRALAFAIG
ncbi:hypothetical protein EYF80_038632 [Liparis tanakae]|uniref:Uncharacterized protein n=1 Tax=Liparis tanakae TaxID=230148 RepID=A0A4Z2GEQ6_9TELE|nr:hypothetical protein EYF80_038632 [Liparis tanakae]